DARVVDGPALTLLRAPRLPRGLGPRAGGDHPPVPAPGGDVRARAADQDPRPGGLRALLPGGGRAARPARAAARAGAARPSRARDGAAAADRARAGVGGGGRDRRLLPPSRLRDDRGGSGGDLPAGDRGGALESRRLQVGVAGAARTPAGHGHLPGHRGGGPAARAHLPGGRRGRGQRGRPRHRTLEEGRRAGGRRGGAGGHAM
ncbi:MAG: Ribonuclease III, partial [uncultured Solirubrobacteraceae bacterium]